jgi:hypothetical protein
MGGYLRFGSTFRWHGLSSVEGSHGGLSSRKDLDVWRVTDEGMKNGTRKEK